VIDFLVWFGLGWSFGNVVVNIFKGRRELSEFTFSTQMLALLCTLIGLFA